MGEGGGGRDPWWWQTAARKQLSATLEEILASAWARLWESGRRGKIGGGRYVAESDAGSKGHRYSGTEIGDSRVDE